MQVHSPEPLGRRAEVLLGGSLLPNNYRCPGHKLAVHINVTSPLSPALCPTGNSVYLKSGSRGKDGNSEESDCWMLPGFFRFLLDEQQYHSPG